MNLQQFAKRNWLACSFVAAHTLLIVLWAWIELDHAWDDMNPTMLVWAALHIADYPLHLALRPLVDITTRTGTYLFVLLIGGGLFWYCIGVLLSVALRLVHCLPVRRIGLHC